MTHALGAAWLVRFGLAAALSVALSGAPRAVAAVAGKTAPCAQECGDSTGDSGCPPACPYGSCARIVPAVLDDAFECGIGAPTPGQYPCDEASPPAPAPRDGVFHPPRP